MSGADAQIALLRIADAMERIANSLEVGLRLDDRAIAYAVMRYTLRAAVRSGSRTVGTSSSDE